MGFNKVGDSTLTKVMTIKDGQLLDVRVAKCIKCGKDTAECTCTSDVEEKKDESAGQD